MWRAGGTTKAYSQNAKQMLSVDYWIKDVESAECPVSLITPRSFELVQLFVRSAKVREETGTTFDLSQAPGWLYDAAALLQEQKIRADVERQEAIRKLT